MIVYINDKGERMISVEEIAKILKISKSTARLHLLKAKEYEPLIYKNKFFYKEEDVKPFLEGKVEAINS